MSEELLPFYEKELRFLRESVSEFAKQHERIANRLVLKEGVSRDPHVERLLQGVAYLNARIRKKLDDDFPELAHSLLGILYPHFVRPFPSASIMRFELRSSEKELFDGYSLEPRTTILETEPESKLGINCRFQTCYPVTLWPIKVNQANFMHRPFSVPESRYSSQARSCIRIVLESFSASSPLEAFNLDNLRFYLNPGRSSVDVYALYEALFTRTLEIIVSPTEESGSSAAPIVFSPDSLKPVGLNRLETILPQDPRSFPGYSLLTEFFAFPEKFLFFDFSDLKGRLKGMPSHVEVTFLLDALNDDLARTVETETFQLGCTPAVNLFQGENVRFKMDQRSSEYHVDPSPRKLHGVEVFSVDDVKAISPDGNTVSVKPFFSFKHQQTTNENQMFWHSAYRLSEGQTSASRERKRELWMSFVELDGETDYRNDWTICVETTCHNRSLPEHLPFGPNRPHLEMPEGRGAVGSMACLSRPTPAYSPATQYGVIWKLVSLLTLNHLSITDGKQGAAVLKEMLLLHDLPGGGRSMISEGVLSVDSKKVTRPMGLHSGGFGRGTQVFLELDESFFTGSGAYLFSTVLNEFFAMYATINSFVELQVSSRQRREVEEPWKWPMRAGEKVLL